MCTARLPTVRVSVATTRCQSRGGVRYTHRLYLPPGYTYPPTPGYTYPTVPTSLPPPPEGTWYQRYHLLPRRDLAPEIPTPTPSPNRLTDTCGNITFPQLLLRAVNMTDPFWTGLAKQGVKGTRCYFEICTFYGHPS